MGSYQLLFVEDDELMQAIYRRMVNKWKQPIHYEFRSSVKETIELLEIKQFDVIVLDYMLNDGDSFEILPYINNTPVIFVSAMEDVSVAVKAMRLGAFDYLLKDLDNQFTEILPLTLERAIEQEKNKRLLRESEERYRDLFENSNDLIQSVSPDGSFIYVNPMWLQVLEYSKEEITQLSFLDIIHSDYKEHCKSFFKKIMEGQAFENEELKLVSKFGNEIIVEGNLYCRMEEGVPVATRAVFSNITEKKLAEEELKENQRKYNMAIDAGKTGIAHWMLETDDFYISPKLKDLLGYSEKEVPNNRASWMKLVHEDDRNKAIRDVTDYVKGITKKYEGEYRMLHKNGSIRWFLARGVAKKDPSGRVVQILGAATDITLLKQTEEKLRESRLALKNVNTHLERLVEKRTEKLQLSNQQLRDEIEKRKQVEGALKRSEEDYKGLFENAHDAIIVYNPKNGKVIDVNERACELYGYNQKEFIKLSLKELSKKPDRAKRFIDQAVKKEGKYSFESVQFKKDGSEINLEISSSLLSYRDKPAILSINRDITKRKQMEQMINNERKMRLSALIDGQEIERKRVSRELHDGLGQLLTAAKLHLKLIFKLQTGKKVSTHIKEANKIIDDTITEVRRISHHLMPTLLNDFGLVAALNKMAGQFSTNSSVEVRFTALNFDERLPGDCEIGLYRIAQEAINNAIKYANAKKINIDLIKKNDLLALTITDDGKGFISEKILKTHLGGSGNGIYNMYERAELINSKFSIDSVPRKGTTIKIEMHI